MNDETISEGSEIVSEGSEVVAESSEVVADSSQTDEILELLQNIDSNHTEILSLLNDNLPVFFDTSRLLLSYGFVYVPLVFVCIMLWWFFKQFLQRF